MGYWLRKIFTRNFSLECRRTASLLPHIRKSFIIRRLRSNIQARHCQLCSLIHLCTIRKSRKNNRARKLHWYCTNSLWLTCYQSLHLWWGSTQCFIIFSFDRRLFPKVNQRQRVHQLQIRSHLRAEHHHRQWFRVIRAGRPHSVPQHRNEHLLSLHQIYTSTNTDILIIVVLQILWDVFKFLNTSHRICRTIIL